MKKGMLIFMALFLIGCSDYSGQGALKNFIVHPESWLSDPHFAEYKEQLDALESSYLRKEIGYAEYVQKKKELDAKYDAEVKQREDIIDSNQQ